MRPNHLPALLSCSLAFALAACQGHLDGGVTIAMLTPGAGSARGGEVVTIYGSGLVGGTEVRFGDRPAARVDVIEPGARIEAVTPRGVAGTVDVVIDVPGGATTVLPAAFRFEAIDVSYEDYTSVLPPDTLDGRGAEMIDVDGDGDLDLVVAVQLAPNRLLVNDGTGHYVESDGLPELLDADGDATTPPVALAENTVDVGAGDLDGDGDLDLYLSNYDEADRLYRNRGDGTFEDASALLPPAAAFMSHSSTLADLDADGDLDVLVAVDGTSRLLRSIFSDDGVLAFEDVAGALPSYVDNTIAFTVVDVDLDGDLDTVAANHQEAGTIRLFLNDGTATFSDAPAGQVPPTSTACRLVLAADFTGDGAADLFALNTEQDRLYVNDGRGFFFDDTTATVPYDMVYSAGGAVLDADLDGDLDVAIAVNGSASRLYLNDGGGVLADWTVLLPEGLAHSMDVAAGDADGDGDIDLFFSNDQAEQDAFYLLEPPRSGP